MTKRIGGHHPQPVSHHPASPAVTATNPRPAAAPQTAAPAPRGWAPKLVDQAKTAARNAVINQASQERALSVGKSTTVAGVGLSFDGKISERVALKNDDPLVAGDARRKAAAATGEVVWTQLSAKANASAGAGAALTPNVSAAFGLSSGAEVTAIVAGQKSLSLQNVGGTLQSQGQTLALTVDPERLLADHHAPGTELMIRGHASANGSVNVHLAVPTTKVS